MLTFHIKCRLKRFFGDDLHVKKTLELRLMKTGRLFHNLGAHTEKARSS